MLWPVSKEEGNRIKLIVGEKGWGGGGGVFFIFFFFTEWENTLKKLLKKQVMESQRPHPICIPHFYLKSMVVKA